MAEWLEPTGTIGIKGIQENMYKKLQHGKYTPSTERHPRAWPPLSPQTGKEQADSRYKQQGMRNTPVSSDVMGRIQPKSGDKVDIRYTLRKGPLYHSLLSLLPPRQRLPDNGP